MASESEAFCEEDPNFAVICAFFEKFGQLMGITDIGICQLKSMLENTHEVSPCLIDLHIKLLRKIKKTVSPPEKWERYLTKFCHTFSSLHAWELERFGYKNTKPSIRIRVLKELIEAQFDLNAKFKLEINKFTSKDLRSQPLGRDKFGHAYWFQSDDNYQIRVYKEDLDDEKWTLVAKDRNGLVTLISNLKDIDGKSSSDSAGNEDSNSLSEKPILDTGQQDTDSKKTSDDEDSNLEKDEDKEEVKLEVKKENEETESLKRPREEEEQQQESIVQKNKIKHMEFVPDKTEVSESIEEPVMKIEGEGSGADNENCVVGEVIEEDIIYFYGLGNGVDCQTGNNSDGGESNSSKTDPSNENDTQSASKTKEETPGLQHKESSKDSPKQLSTEGNEEPPKSPNNHLEELPISSNVEKSIKEIQEENLSNSQFKEFGKDVNEEEFPNKSFPLDDVKEGERSKSPIKEECSMEGKQELAKSPVEEDFSKKVESDEYTVEQNEGLPKVSLEESTNQIDEEEFVKSPKKEEPVEKTKDAEPSISQKIEEIKVLNENPIKDYALETVKAENFPKSPIKEESPVEEKSQELKEAELPISTMKEEEAKVPDHNESSNESESKTKKIESCESQGDEKQTHERPPIEESIEEAKLNEEISNNDFKEENNSSELTDNKLLNNMECVKASEKTIDSISSPIEVKSKEANPIEKEHVKTENHLDVSQENFKKESSSSQNEDQIEVSEPICVKKTAYVCGEETLDLNKQTDVVKEEEQDKSNDIRSPVASLCETGNKERYRDKNVVESEPTTTTTTTTDKTDNNQILDEKSVTVSSLIDQNMTGQDTPSINETKHASALVISTTDHENANQTPEKAEINERPKLKAVKKSPTNTKESNQLVKDEPQSKESNSADSSVTSSPPEDVNTESAVEVKVDDSGEVKEPQSDHNAKKPQEPTLSSFSLDYKEEEDNPLPERPVRKRGLDAATVEEPEDGPEKKIKLKGRRQIDTALRKSVEQRIEQMHGSSSDSKESEEESENKEKTPGRKKKTTMKKDPVETEPVKKEAPKRDPAKKNSRILMGLQIDEDSLIERPQLRQSRRIAQLKIKEQVESKYKLNYDEGPVIKKKGKDDKHDKKKDKDSDSEPSKKKKKRKEKPANQIFNEKRPWQSSSEDSEELAEEEEEDIEDDYELALGPLKSDHEFSPESEEDDDEEWQPLKRARTAKKEENPEEIDDLPCQKCEKNDHPEWILLCDKCDNGWHCSCLRPPLLGIPEGDWFCPPCEHIILLERLQTKLIEYDKKLNKKEIEDRRKERLAYVGISLNNVLPNNTETRKKKKRRHSDHKSEDTTESESESEHSQSLSSDSDEPIYQLRQRRQAKSYKFNEYDEMIKDAIGEDEDQKEDTAGNLGRGKDIQTIVKGLEPEEKPTEKTTEEVEERPTAANLKKMLRKKHRKLNSLDFDSEEEDISDEDFKGTSSESEDDDEEFEEEDEDDYSDNSEDSDDYVGRKRRKNAPVRRSTRARTRRYDDEDFINDDDSDDETATKKKKKSTWDDYESDESELSNYGKKRKGKKKKTGHEPNSKKSKSKIQYGGLTSSEDDTYGRGRRTRGKKTTYVDTVGSESEEETASSKKNPRKIESDDDEDFIANDEEGEEEDKADLDEEEEDDGEEEEDDNSEEERRVQRSLLVPKIYIKKPTSNKKSTQVIEKVGSSNGERAAVEKEKLPMLVTITNSHNTNETVGEDVAMTIKRPSIVHEPIVSNVTALIKNDLENDDLSEPPGISLPLFEELDASTKEAEKKRRGRTPGKKNVNSITQPAIEIAAPPQPFSQAQPTPSVITRMLQAKAPVISYPSSGRIRTKNFAAIRGDEEVNQTEPSDLHVSPSSSPSVISNVYSITGGAPLPYGIPQFPRGSPSTRGSYNPSPSGGGPINLTDSAPRIAPAGPPRYPSEAVVRPALHIPYRSPNFVPPVVTTNGPPVTVAGYPTTAYPAPGSAPAPGPPESYYGSYPPPSVTESTIPPIAYEGLPPEGGPVYQEPSYSAEEQPQVNPSENEESGGEFAGLASYFSSQREDDLES